MEFKVKGALVVVNQKETLQTIRMSLSQLPMKFELVEIGDAWAGMVIIAEFYNRLNMVIADWTDGVTLMKEMEKRGISIPLFLLTTDPYAVRSWKAWRLSARDVIDRSHDDFPSKLSEAVKRLFKLQ